MTTPPFAADWLQTPPPSPRLTLHPAEKKALFPTTPLERKVWILAGRNHPSLEAVRAELEHTQVPTEALLEKGTNIMLALDILEVKYTIAFQISMDKECVKEAYTRFLTEENYESIEKEASDFSRWIKSKGPSCELEWQLSLSNLDLRHIPDEIRYMKALRSIELENNPRLAWLPEALTSLPYLKTIKSDNPEFQRDW